MAFYGFQGLVSVFPSRNTLWRENLRPLTNFLRLVLFFNQKPNLYVGNLGLRDETK